MPSARFKNEPILFRTIEDTHWCKGITHLFVCSYTFWGVSVFLLILSFAAAGGNARTVATASDPASATCLMMGLLCLLIAFLLFLPARRFRRGAQTVLYNNSITVYPGYVCGRCTSLDIQPTVRSFELPFSSITGLRAEKHRVAHLPGGVEVDVLCLYTAERKYEVWGIADVPMVINHLSYFLYEN